MWWLSSSGTPALSVVYSKPARSHKKAALKQELNFIIAGKPVACCYNYSVEQQTAGPSSTSSQMNQYLFSSHFSISLHILPMRALESGGHNVLYKLFSPLHRNNRKQTGVQSDQCWASQTTLHVCRLTGYLIGCQPMKTIRPPASKVNSLHKECMRRQWMMLSV